MCQRMSTESAQFTKSRQIERKKEWAKGKAHYPMAQMILVQETEVANDNGSNLSMVAVICAIDRATSK